MDLTEIGSKIGNWTDVAPMASSCEHSAETSGDLKVGDFLDQLTDTHLFKVSDPYSSV
jgi:hypothetical protein